MTEAGHPVAPKHWPQFPALEELDVGDGGKVPRVHGAVAPDKPLIAARKNRRFHSHHSISGAQVADKSCSEPHS